jgi:glucose-6-phosphate isomerase
MTKGHFHRRREAAEYYWGIAGSGVLLLLDEAGNCTAQAVEPGSLHYIPGFTAHRLVNTGSEKLVVGACWGSDAGHDYGALTTEGFPVRVVERRGEAVCEEKK